ncbi:DUF3108 domain-containing protein [Massilia sp. TWR1-2-2]|uniref:DUF3108 domain-containing protein n=1 Tax=Massilia sp. TWR1-2-2 TaxID=2804584 RepID=UPI003CF63D66
MTFASFIFRYRRALSLFGASVLLHLLALWWILPYMLAPGAHEPPPVETIARLIAAPPRPPPAPKAAPATAPAAPAKAVARARRSPAPAPAALVDVAALASQPPMGDQAGAAQILSAVTSVVVAIVEQPAAVEPVTPAPPPPPRYRVDLPPSARMLLDVARRDADGTRWSGEAEMAWQLKGSRYSMKVEAGISVVVTRVNLVALQSEGSLGDTGFAPSLMTEKRRGRSRTATHFRDGRITFSASQQAFDQAAGAQDKATIPLQLAAIARADSGQLAAGVDIQVAEDKDASVFHFVVLGQEQLDTRLGKIQAWRLSRPPKPGAYASRLDIWLAPAHGWLPVQISNIEASGAVTTQTVNKIVLTDSGT